MNRVSFCGLIHFFFRLQDLTSFEPNQADYIFDSTIFYFVNLGLVLFVDYPKSTHTPTIKGKIVQNLNQNKKKTFRNMKIKSINQYKYSQNYNVYKSNIFF